MITLKTHLEGQSLGIAGGNYRIITSGAETNGEYAVIEMSVPPGAGPPPHEHPDFIEMFYVVSGEFEFRSTEGSKVISEGGMATIPLNGSIHCFKNISPEIGKLLCTVIPAGLDEYFTILGLPLEQGEFVQQPQMTPERIEFIKEVDQRFGQKTYPRDYLDSL